jgi:hypothetical protein
VLQKRLIEAVLGHARHPHPIGPQATFEHETALTATAAEL